MSPTEREPMVFLPLRRWRWEYLAHWEFWVPTVIGNSMLVLLLHFIPFIGPIFGGWTLALFIFGSVLLGISLNLPRTIWICHYCGSRMNTRFYTCPKCGQQHSWD